MPSNITIHSEDGFALGAYRADDPTDPVGAVVVIQEIFGVTPHIQAVTDKFSQAGFVAVAPQLFDRISRNTVLGYEPDEVAKAREFAWDNPIDKPLKDIAATIALLVKETKKPVGVVGFCFGGMLTAAVASRHSENVSAAVAYYPSQAVNMLADDNPQVPLMVHLGDRDERVGVADGQRLMSLWPEATFYRYENSGHGFNCDDRPGFDPEAASVAFGRTIEFLRSHTSF